MNMKLTDEQKELARELMVNCFKLGHLCGLTDVLEDQQKQPKEEIKELKQKLGLTEEETE